MWQVGGGAGGGGGGAGGLLYNSSYPVSTGSMNITVGSGGTGVLISPGQGNGANGKNSSFGSLIAVGGGGGGGYNGQSGSSGGSGGGSGQTSGAGGRTGGSGTAGQGNSGGTDGGFTSAPYPGGGGGGSGGTGGSATSNSAPGVGGLGNASSINGTLLNYSRGGAGQTYDSAAAGVNGSSNTGNGGVAAGNSQVGGAGGSGIVIIKYLTPTSIIYNASYAFTNNGTYAYRWHSWGNGATNLYNLSPTRSYMVNVPAPVILFTHPTQANNSVIPVNFSFVNVSVNRNVTNCTLNFSSTLYNMSFINLDASTSANATAADLVGATLYTYYARCYDTLGNTNTTEVRTLTYNASYVKIINISPNGTTFAINNLVNISANVTSYNLTDTVTVNITLPDASLVTLSMANATALYRANFTLSNQTGTYLLAITANDSSGLKVTVNTSFNVIIQSANLTIFDDTDVILGSQVKYRSDVVHFFANYTNSTGINITGSNVFCTLNLNRTGFPNAGVNMSFNSTSKAYEFNTTFGLGGVYYWNVSCDGSMAGFNASFANDTVSISSYTSITNASPNGTTHAPSDVINISANVTSDGIIDLVFVNLTLANSSVIRLSMTNITTMYLTNFTLPPLTGAYLLAFTANDTTGLTTTLNTSFNVNYRNSNLTIFDDTDVILGSQVKYPGNNAHFFANYTNTSGTNISGGTCTLNLNKTGFPNSGVSMPFNASSKLYEFNTTFTSGGIYEWNVSCNGSLSGFTTVFANDTTNISVGGVVVVNMSPNGTSFTQETQARIAVNATSTAGVDEAWVNITLPDSTLVKLNLYNSSSQPDIWNATFTNTAQVGQYNMSFFANDTAGINGTERATFNITDSRNPNVTNVNAAPGIMNLTSSVNITADIQDETLIDKAIAQVTRSNGSAFNLTMSNLAGFVYNATYQTVQGEPLGRWNVTIIANDTRGNVNASMNTSFTVNDPTPPIITFIRQRPADIDAFNIFGNPLNITYNISDETQVNIASIILYHKTNSSTDDITYYVNGTAYGGFFNRSGTNSTIDQFATNWTAQLFDANVYPATYNYPERTLELTPHDQYELVSTTQFIKDRFFNVSNTKQFSFLELMSYNRSGTSGPLAIYYCNSSYTTGDPTTSNACTNFFNIAPTSTYNHSHSAFSSHHIIPFTFNTTTGNIGNVHVTALSYFLFKGQAGAAGWNVSNIPNISREDTTQYTTDNGATWSNINITIDAHLHQYDGSQTFWYYACANDTQGNSNCSQLRSDLINLSGLPPTAPDVYRPTEGSYRKNQTINYTAAQSPNSYPITGYNITLETQAGSFVRTIINNNSPNLSYVWNTSDATDGNYHIRVQACDNLSQCSSGYSANFTIDNSLPNVTALNISPAIINKAESVNITVNATDNISIGTTLAEITWPNGTVLNHTMSFLSGLTYNYTKRHAITDPEGRYTVRIIANDTAGNLNDSIVGYYNISNITINRTIYDNSSLSNSTIEDSDINNTVIAASYVRNSSIVNTSVQHSSVQNSTIERSTINETQINRSDIQDSTTLNATITWSTVTDSTISNSTVNTSAVSASNITNSRIENTSVQNSTMIRTTFEKGTVVSSNITNSTVSDSTIENSTVYGSTLTNVTLHGTLTVNCTMLNATVSGSLLDNLTVENSTVFDTNASRSYINDSYVNGSTINQTWMAGNLIDNCTIWNTTIINSTAVDCNISDSYVIDSDVNSSSVWNSSVIRSILTDGSFISNSTINRSIGRRVIVINGTARGSNITRCNFTGSIIEDSEAIDTTASAGAGGGTRITQGSSISNATMIASNATNVTVVNGTVQDEDLTDIIIINNEQDANCSCQLKRNSTIRGQVIFTGNSGPTMGKSGISLRCDEDGLGNSITGGGTGTGLTTSGKDNILIQGCTITNFTTGILIENSSNTRVINTQTLNNTIGARIENSTGVIISRLNSTGNNHPARFVNTPNMTAQNTTIGAGLTIENQTAGNINFTSEVNFTSSQNMLAYLTISNNSAIANSSISPGTNTSAIVTFINVNLSDPRVQTGDDGGANFRDCPPEQCQFISKNTSNQSFIFNVTHFSSYRLEDNIVRSNITNTSANNSLIDTSEVDNSTIRDSYVNHSNVNRSLLLNDTVVNSTITQSIIVNSSIVNTTIDNSTVNASYVNQSDIDSSQLIGSNVTASTIYNSNVTNSTINTSTITSSNITNSQAQNSTILNTTITKGIISDSTINSSVILNSSMTDSTLFNITASNSAINTTSASRCTITNSSIQNSTMDNCTISNSNTDDSFVNHTTLLNGSATDSRIVGSNIQNSTVNTSDIRESDINRTRAENTTITNSTITDSTITRGQIQNTSIDNSTFTSSNINRSSIDNTAVTASNITQSTINASDLNTVRAAFSNITNSTITNSLIENSTVYGSVLINVTLNGTYALNCTILNASTTGGTLVNNTITNSTTIESNISASIINNSRINASTVNTSAIDSATVISSAVLNSSITSSTITNSTIANSTINTSSETESDLNRTRAENTTITNSTITDSTITRGQISNSTLDNSSVTGSRINKSSIDNTAINSSNITQSTINASDLNTVRAAFSNITNSTITNSLIENSTVYGSVLINVTLNGTYALNCTILNASTTGGTLVNNTITNSTTIESNISASIINNSRINASKINLTTSQTCTIIDSDVWNTSASSCLLEWSNVSASTFNTGRAWTSIIDNSSIEDGITLNSTINRSTLLHSNVTNSSRIVNTTVVNSTLSSFTLIDFGTVSNEPTAPAIYNLTVTPTIGNQTNAYNITATVLESTGVSVALANVTSPNGNKTTLTMSRQGASATYFAMFTTNITSEEGNHTVALDVNDTLNFRNASMTTSFVIQDITLPLVSNLSPVNGTQFTQDSLVMISANVTDNRGVDKVIATVSMPNSSVRTLTLENRTLYDIYNATFAEARIQGQYNVTISANDSSGNSNSTSATSFVVPFQGGQEVRTSVLLSQNISVNGSGLIIASDNVTLDCNGFAVIGNGTPIMINVTDKSNVTIKGCGLINATVCLLVRNATNSRTLGVTCDGATDAGAIVDPSFDTLIENSSFSNSPNGLIVFESNHTIVRNCNFTNNTIAINVTLSNFTEIRNNSFRNNTAGLWIFSGNMTLAYHNEFLESRQYAIVSNATGNAFNTSVAGIAQGNRYTGVSAIRIYDLNRDGYGDAGQDLPYNSTNRGNVSGHVQDFGPITSKINTPPNQTRTVPNMTLSVSYSASINLYEYFNDSEGDTITYITIGNITTNISINQTTQKLTVRSLTHLTGPDWFVIIANDSINATYSNNITATVISDPSPAGIGGGGGSGRRGRGTEAP